MNSYENKNQQISGWIKTATATPELQVADIDYNCTEIIKMVQHADERGASLIVFPELAVTGYTCADLFQQTLLLENATQGVFRIARESSQRSIVIVVGFPFFNEGKVYNAAAFLYRGKILGIVPKRNLPNYGEYYECRWFTPGTAQVDRVSLYDRDTGETVIVPFGMNLLFRDSNQPYFCLAAELCEDLWVCDTPATQHALAGATIIANCSASDETVGKADYRRSLVQMTSARLVCAYLYANAGPGESTQDMVFGGQNFICENGKILKESTLYQHEIKFADIDLEHIMHERLRMNTFKDIHSVTEKYDIVTFTMEKKMLPGFDRDIDAHPFVPSNTVKRNRRCEEILNIQVRGLMKRLQHIHCDHAVIGVSGGLDSTLALLVCVRAFDLLNLPHKNIIAVTMPAFGTTDRTYQNAVSLASLLDVTLREISIKKAVQQHFADITHDISNHNVVYENAQARERTQILMDIANAENGIVIGTGDMSELALGWATYNGDHMSMYAVNTGVPKTLVQYLISYYAGGEKNTALQNVLKDILATPISPELLPAENGEISQITEDLVGPYELHDFFLYQVLRYGDRPSKIYAMAIQAFEDEYPSDIVFKWLKTFYRRFFQQQYKRSCLPDGPKVGSIAVSPRGDLRMPSDACMQLWIKELESMFSI